MSWMIEWVLFVACFDYGGVSDKGGSRILRLSGQADPISLKKPILREGVLPLVQGVTRRIRDDPVYHLEIYLHV